MNCTEYYSETNTSHYFINNLILLTTLFNTVYLVIVNNNIARVRQDINEQLPKLPTYSSIP